MTSRRKTAEKALSVGEVAVRSGLAVSAIHFYEAQGLIHGWRSAGNQRRFPRSVLRRVSLIKVAQRIGVPLEVIGKALAPLPKGRVPTAADWRAMSYTWKALLDERIERLERLRDCLTGCIGCGCLSMTVCPLRNPEDRLSAEGPGPHLLESPRAGVKRKAVRGRRPGRVRPRA